MSGENAGPVTFAILDQEKGVPAPPLASGEEYPLPAWYRTVRELPLDELGVEDICKACRQNIHLEHVVPLALQLLETEPLSGALYDGELLVSLKSIPPDYWSKHEDERLLLKSLIESVRGCGTITADVRQDAEELLIKASNGTLPFAN